MTTTKIGNKKDKKNSKKERKFHMKTQDIMFSHFRKLFWHSVMLLCIFGSWPRRNWLEDIFHVEKHETFQRSYISVLCLQYSITV